MNEDGREEHRSQNRDQVREHWQRQWRGVKEVMTQTEPISLTCTNNQNYQPIVLYDDEIQTKSNVPMISYEYEVIAHKKFHEIIDKSGHIQMCHVCEESNARI